MTLALLQKYIERPARIAQLMEEKRRLIDAATDCNVHYGIIANTSDRTDKVGDNAVKIADLDAQIRLQEDEMCAVEIYIASVARANPLLATVMKYKFIDGVDYRHIHKTLKKAMNDAPALDTIKGMAWKHFEKERENF